MEFVGAACEPRGLQIDVDELESGVYQWSVANDGPETVVVTRISLRWRLDHEPTAMFRNGYQSWSPSGGGAVTEASGTPVGSAPGLVRAMYHADERPTAPGQLQSELVTALAVAGADAIVAGFDGGARHDGTFRLAGRDLLAEAHFGGARLAPGERRDLHAIRITRGDVHFELDEWAKWAGQVACARVGAPYQTGWCSWYQYFAGVTEADVRANLAEVNGWPLDVFVIDDGYQAAIGDWLER